MIPNQHIETDEHHTPSPRLSGVIIVPIAALALMGTFAWGLFNSSDKLPSALLGKPVPAFSLPPVQGHAGGLSDVDLQGHISLVNVFASWCVPCRAEHPLLMEWSKTSDVPIYGINYKDPPDQAEAWLNELGNPYTRIGADIDGRAAIEWGVYGIPETYVISANGTIAYRYVGPLTRRSLTETILPVITRLKQQAALEVAQ